MTIASAFNDIAVAQGGTAAKSGAITAAIDALNDALAGSDQPQAKTIEQAVRLLGEHIGGGGGSSTHKVYISDSQTLNAPDVAVTDSNGNTVATDTETVSITTPGGSMEATFITFNAVDGGVYEISADNGDFTQSQLFKFPDPDSPYWGGQLLVNGKISITAPNFDIMAMVTTNR